MRTLRGSRVVLATGNEGKAREYAALLGKHLITVIPSDVIDIPAPPETENTFEGNARIKAEHAMRRTGLAALAEDSGLEVEALGNAPGVATADWAQGSDGRDYMSAMERIRAELEAAEAPCPQRARFRAVICVAWPDGESAAFEGTANGRVIWPPRGRDGFGFDPMFVPDGSAKTFAEMTVWEKSARSHRAEALKSLARNCLELRG